MPDEKRQDERVPVALRVRLRFANLEGFVNGYATNISRTGIFLEGATPQSPGTEVGFEVALADGTCAFRGDGRVIWSRASGSSAGVAVRFSRLDDASRVLLDALAADDKIRAGSIPPPLPRSVPPATKPLPRSRLDAAIVAALDRELAALESSLAGTPIKRDERVRRSVRELDGELERLSADVRARRSHPAAVHGSARPPSVASHSAQARASRGARPVASMPPAASDYEDIPAVLSMLGDDGSVQQVVTPVPSARVDDDSGEEVVLVPSRSSVPPEAMREPTPVPESDGEIDGLDVIPQAPPLPRSDVAASAGVGGGTQSLPDLELADMLEPGPDVPRPDRSDDDRESDEPMRTLDPPGARRAGERS